jgi:hypothetical protein
LRPPLGGVSRVGEGCVARLHLVPSRSGFAPCFPGPRASPPAALRCALASCLSARPARRGQGLFFPTGCGLRCAGAPACALEPAPQRPVGGDEEEGPAPSPCRSICHDPSVPIHLSLCAPHPPSSLVLCVCSCALLRVLRCSPLRVFLRAHHGDARRLRIAP